MKAAKTVGAWGIVMALSYGAACGMARFAPADVNSTVLLWVGVFAALINATSFQVWRQLNDAAPKAMTIRGAMRIDRVFATRRKALLWKWGISIFAGIGASTCGGLLRVPSLVAHHGTFLTAGYIGLGLTVTLGVLIVVEFFALSRLARELPKRLEEERRKQEVLQRLRPPENQPSGPTTPSAHAA